MVQYRKKNLLKPAFVVDTESLVRDTGRQIDWDVIPQKYGHGAVKATTTANAAQGATSVSVEALEKEIQVGSILHFGGTKYAVLTAVAVVGATTLTVQALAVALVSGDVAYYGGHGHRYVKAGTVMDLLSNGKIVPSEIGTSSVTAYCILETAADEGANEEALTGYGCLLGGHVYDNLLPDATGTPKEISSTFKTELRARGGAWIFSQYSDNT